MDGEEQLVQWTEKTLGDVCIYSWMEEDKQNMEAENGYHKNM